MYRVIGTMSGTSMDGVDVVYIETDGQARVHVPPGLYTTLEYTAEQRAVLFRAIDIALEADARAVVADPGVVEAHDLVTSAHIRAVSQIMERLDGRPDGIGLHGQSILHRPNPEDPSKAFTLQIGSGQQLADALGVNVVHDFRSADVENGGQGAPLAPLYHQALVAGKATLPAAILNLGGIANITLVTDLNPASLHAADVGPANVFMDDFMRDQLGLPFDRDGALAASGSVARSLVDGFFDHPFFTEKGPKSLDRYSFPPPELSGLSNADAMATLMEITVRSVALAVRALSPQPTAVFAAGGGARNAYLMRSLQRALPCDVQPLDAIGSSADMLEAEAFAYLAARHLEGLPLSYPNTTGVSQPTLGGRLAKPQSEA